ncbi:ABC-three component system protein [Pigmentibacter ruber]|uniref:ABC-three component system protein n=1 Tax=Pigmentibacter ruber TaxID=2683196 RepID=UPI00131E8A3C|nr:ABC-three component system protein [Pigmentibacter ruber]
MKNKIQQENNIAKGDILAGSKYIENKIININLNSNSKKNKIQKSKNNKYMIKKNLDKINNYITIIEESRSKKDLEEKLTEANMSDKIFKALKAKEEIYKMISENTFNIEFINNTSNCLSDIITKFELKIEPLIKKNKSRITIDKKTWEVIEYVSNKYKLFDSQDVSGMLYMLAGHCHIKWVP